jgi:hypothetical protein
MQKKTLNVKSIIKSLGGAKKFSCAHALLAEQAGYDALPVATVRSWVARNFIHWNRLPEILHLAEVSGVDLDFRNFIEDAE